MSRLWISLCLLPFVFALASADDAPSLDELVKNLAHDDLNVRRDAAYQIHQLGSEAEAALAALIKALGGNRQVWFHAVQTLTRLGPAASPAIPALLERIGDGGQVGYRTSYPLARIGPPVIAPLTEALKNDKKNSVELRVNVARVLGWIGPEARDTVPILAAFLRGDQKVRDQAAWALGRIGAPAVALLVEALRDESEKVRASAMHALATVGPEAAVAQPVVCTLTGDEDAKVRELALTALRTTDYPPEKLVPLPIDRLGDADANVRAAARTSLVRLEPATVVAPLEAVVKSESALAIRSAAAVLSRIGPAANATAPSLIDALESHQSSETRVALGRALGRLGLPSLDPLLAKVERSQLDEPGIRAFAVALAAIGTSAVPDLTTALDRDSPDVRLVSAAALVEIGSPAMSPAAPALTRLLHDAAARALGALGEAASLANDSLITRTLDDSPSVRAAAVAALRSTGLGTSTLCRVLVAALGDEEAVVRETAVEGLVGLDAAAGNAEAALLASLRDESSRVRTLAATALGQIEVRSVEKVIAALVTALKSSAEQTSRYAVLETIGGIGSRGAKAVPAIIDRAAAAEATDTERVLAVRVLGKIGESATGAFPTLTRTCAEGPAKLRAASATALVRVEKTPRKVVPVLVKALDDTESVVRLRAIEAIGSLGPAARAAEEKLFERIFEGWDDRRSAFEALDKIGPQSVPLLTKTLADEHRLMKRFAAKHLGALGADARDALSALREALDKKKSKPVRADIEKAIAAIEAAMARRRVRL